MSELSPNTLLAGRYTILGPLGAGGMANVYHARDLNLQREVAIKLLREDLIADAAFQARFLQEGRAAANLLHPNIDRLRPHDSAGCSWPWNTSRGPT
jgi:serine/threonine-protein kinase